MGADNNFENFVAEQDEAEKIGFKRRMEDAPTPGMLPNGKLNVVNPDDPPFEPKIIDEDDSDLEDISDIDDDPTD